MEHIIKHTPKTLKPCVKRSFVATTKEGIACHVELDNLMADDIGPCIPAFVFYLKDKNNPDSYDASCEDELYVISDKDCNIDDLDAVETVVRKILSSDIVSP